VDPLALGRLLLPVHQYHPVRQLRLLDLEHQWRLCLLVDPLDLVDPLLLCYPLDPVRQWHQFLLVDLLDLGRL